MSGAKECCSCMLTCTQPHWGGFLNVRPQGLISVMVSMSIMSVMFDQVVVLILLSFKEWVVQEGRVHKIISTLLTVQSDINDKSFETKALFHGGPWGPVLGDPDFNETCWGAYSSALNNLVPYRLRMLIHWLVLWSKFGFLFISFCPFIFSRLVLFGPGPPVCYCITRGLFGPNTNHSDHIEWLRNHLGIVPYLDENVVDATCQTKGCLVLLNILLWCEVNFRTEASL